jgi:hypothetical protein
MSISMIRSRTEVIAHTAAGERDRWITRETHHGRDLIRGLRHGLSSPANLFTLEQPLVATRKVTAALISAIEQLTRDNPCLARKSLARILEESADFPSVSKTCISRSHRL